MAQKSAPPAYSHSLVLMSEHFSAAAADALLSERFAQCPCGWSDALFALSCGRLHCWQLCIQTLSQYPTLAALRLASLHLAESDLACITVMPLAGSIPTNAGYLRVKGYYSTHGYRRPVVISAISSALEPRATPDCCCLIQLRVTKVRQHWHTFTITRKPLSDAAKCDAFRLP